MDGNTAFRCPLFLLSEETVGELEPLLRDLRGSGYIPLSLRDLFRCRRGLRRWPSRPCGILLRGVTFSSLRAVLHSLDRWETPVSLFGLPACGAQEAEELRSCRWLSFYGDAEASAPLLPPEGMGGHIAAFCEAFDGRTIEFLRVNRIWMAVTGIEAAAAAPDGIDVLPALPVEKGNRLPELLARWHRACTLQRTPIPLSFSEPIARSRTVFLPLAQDVPLSDPPLAARLGILGATPDGMERALLHTDWNPVFDPAGGAYRLCPAWRGLAEETLKNGLSAEEIGRLLEEGSYLLIRYPAEAAGGTLLVYGYDGEEVLFWGMTALRPGVCGRLALSPRQLETFCTAGSLTRLTPSGAEAERTENPTPVEGCHGWEASVAFANWTVSRGETAPISASSLRTFLEERQICALRLRRLCAQEGLYAEVLDGYEETLKTEGRDALRKLQGKELADGVLALQIGELLERLLNAEALCRRTLETGMAQLESLRTFQKEKRARKG